VCGVVLLALLPWGYRNQAATGHFVLTSLWMGPSLYDGLHPGATGDSDMAFYDRDNLQAGGLSEHAVNQHYKQAAVDFVKANPGRTLELAAIKTWRFWKPWPNAGQFGGPLGAAAIAIPYLPLVLLAMWGAVRGGGGCWTRLLSAGPILYFAALHMVFVSSLRYRLPAEYPLAVRAASGLLTLRNRSGNNTCLPPQPTPEV
jgi:hypothetical protein